MGLETEKETTMSRLTNIREELEKLKSEIMTKHSKPGETTLPGESFGKVAAGLEEKLEHQIGELNKLVHTTMAEAEDKVAEHPVATVAGAMALGIVIGRLSAR
jgi:ElaB/YqjD/DUF883 family membrane-anchored ribosome-binding protein